MKRITLSSSMRNQELIRQTIAILEKFGITGLFPNLDGEKNPDAKTLKRYADDCFVAIDSSDALYVFCPNGHIGTSVSLEIGYAHARQLPIIFSEPPTDLSLQAFAHAYIPLNEINKLASM